VFTAYEDCKVKVVFERQSMKASAYCLRSLGLLRVKW